MRVGVSSIEGIKHADKFFFGGEWVSPSTSSKIDVINPATEEVFLTVAEAHEADINRAVASARDAFDHGPWPRMSPAERTLINPGMIGGESAIMRPSIARSVDRKSVG